MSTHPFHEGDKDIMKNIPSVSEALEAAAQTFRERQKTYGDNWLHYGPAVAALFPNGITLKSEDDHARFQLFCLIMVKWSRYAENFSKGGHEDSTHDNITYTAMLHHLDRRLWAKEKGALEETFEASKTPFTDTAINRLKPPGANGMYKGDVVAWLNSENEEKLGLITEVFQDGEFVVRYPYYDKTKPTYNNIKWHRCRPLTEKEKQNVDIRS